MKNNIMPLHIQSIYIYVLKYGFSIDEIYYNMYNKAPLTSSKRVWDNIHGVFPPMTRTIGDAMHLVLIHALLKPQIIDDVELPMNKLKKDIVTFIAEHAYNIPLQNRIFKMRIKHILNNVANFMLKGII